MMDKQASVQIKKGTSIFTSPRGDIFKLEETYDGIELQLTNGLILQYGNPDMPGEVKRKITTFFETFMKGKMFIDLDNYRSPVRVEIE